MILGPFTLIVQGVALRQISTFALENRIDDSCFCSHEAGCWVSLGLSLHQLRIREYPFKLTSYLNLSNNVNDIFSKIRINKRTFFIFDIP